MAPQGFTARLAALSARRPWWTVGAWLVLLVVGMYLTSGIGDVLTSDFQSYVDTDSQKADNLIEERLTSSPEPDEIVVVQSPALTTDDPAFREFADSLVADIRALPDVIAATNFFETEAEGLVSADGHSLLVPILLEGEDDEALEDAVIPVETLIDEADAGNGQFELLATGTASIGREITETSERDLQKAEIFGVPAALIILVIVFGALVAAGVPLLLGAISIVIALGAAALLGQAFELSIFLVNFVTTIGLAVGIDYSLVVIQRFREERRNGFEKLDAIAIAGGTAGKAVAFSGVAVIVAMLGMLTVPNNIFRSLAAGSIFVVFAAVLAGMTLLPAVLSLLGDKINAPRLGFLGRSTGGGGGFWTRSTRLVMAHPVISVVASVTLLVGLTIPYFSINLGFNGVSTLPQDLESVRRFNVLSAEFSGGEISPVEIVIDAGDVNAPAVQEGIASLRDQLAQDGAFGASALTVNDAGDLAVVTAPLTGDPQDDAAESAVRRLRNDYVPAAFDSSDAEVFVTGETADSIDGVQTLNDYTPVVLAVVLGLSFLVLMVVFRSIVVPAKAIVMNLLSVGAAYGLMVLVFQEGFLNELAGFQQVDIVEAWVPLFLFAVLFGLSMDYHVFLLSRIRERYDQTGDNAESVAFGVRSTAGIITGAALIMVAVFAGFASGDLVMLQQFGFGMAVAILLDATIVRVVLVPASMALLGKWNWYLPSWLSWLPDIDMEGNAPKPEASGA
ncbi:MAG: MMPL family transporter [Dehalococcoidia bacterium]